MTAVQMGLTIAVCTAATMITQCNRLLHPALSKRIPHKKDR